MNAKRVLVPIGLGAAAVVGLVLLIAWFPKGAGDAAEKSDVWTCSMHPQIRLPNSGECPICGMALIPVSQLPSAKDALEKRARLETEVVRRRELFKEVRTVGKLDYSERQVAYLSSRINGRIDRLFVDFTGIEVKKGDHLVEIYSPELNVAQNELLLALESAEKEKSTSPAVKGFAQSRLDASRTKLRLLGIVDEQIAELEANKRPRTHLTIFAPIGGTVIEKNVRTGQYINTGDPVYRIADFDPIWLYLNIYEYDIAWVRFGQTVDVQLEAFPGETFSGSIMFIDPFLDDATRTIRVRVNIKNEERRLKPQMFATATIHVHLRPDGSPEPTGLEGLYVCPMHPEVSQAESGNCSICEMPLEKVPERPKFERGSGRGGEGENDKEHGGHKDHADHKEHAGHEGYKDQTGQADHKQHSEHKDHSAEATASATGVLAIPVSAVLDTGRRQIAYRLTKEGAYELVELKLGPRANAHDDSGKRREFFVVLDGLHEGDQIVIQGGFLLDSQRQIEGMPSLLDPTGHAGSTSGHAGHGGAAPSSTQDMPAGHKH